MANRNTQIPDTPVEGEQDTPIAGEQDDTGDAPEQDDVFVTKCGAREVYQPQHIAEGVFGVSGAFQGGKRVRAYLRAKYTRPADAKNTSWVLSPEVARDVFDHFTKQTVTVKVVTPDDATS